jgi:hypothetical protein
LIAHGSDTFLTGLVGIKLEKAKCSCRKLDLLAVVAFAEMMAPKNA